MTVVGVVGSRDFPTLHLVSRYVEQIAAKYPNARILSGGARGVDTLAEDHAVRCGLEMVSYRPYEYENMRFEPEFSIEVVSHPEHLRLERRINPPHFKKWTGAAFCRNGWIVQDADHIVVFWDGRSSGADNMTEQATRAGKLRQLVIRPTAAAS